MDEQKIAEFCGITGADPSSAQGALASANWNLEEAVALYFTAQDEPQAEDNDDEEYTQGPTSGPSGPTLAQPTPAQPTASSSSGVARQPPGQRPKQMTMDDLRKRTEDHDDDSEDDKPQDMFAGGEKSGLAVQNPGQGGGGAADHFKNIMNQARQNRDRPAATGEELDEASRSTHFTGRAQTLGGDDAPSQVVEDPLAAQRARPQNQAPVSRTLHLWQDGISVDDGPLFRFDDPANQNIMAEINRGRAPLNLLNVQPDQAVDLNLEPHKDENYVQPKKKYQPFGGQGNRLGSPVPGPGAASTTTAQQSAPSASSTSQGSGPAKVDVDDSQPTVQLQIRLGDGTRLQSRFNTTHTIGDVYNFVNSASPASAQRSYALMTTFPSKELSDRSLVLGEMSDFKRGGVVVQKWT